MPKTEVPVTLYKLRDLGGGAFAEDPLPPPNYMKNGIEVSASLFVLREQGDNPTPVLSEATRADTAPFSSTSYLKSPMHTNLSFEAGDFTASTSPTKSFRATGGAINTNQRWARAIWRPIAADPAYQVRALSAGSGIPDGFVFGTWKIPPEWEVPEPMPASGTWVNNETPPQRDGWTTIVWPDGSRTTDFYKLRPWYSNGVLSHFTQSSRIPVTFPLDGAGLIGESGTVWSGVALPGGVNPSTWGGRASALPQIALSMRRWEFMAAEASTIAQLDHALDIAIPGSSLKAGFVWPARSQDGDWATSYTGYVPMGSFLALPMSTTIASLGLVTKSGIVAARTLQHRGAYIAARSSNVQMGVEMPFSGDTTYETILSNFASDWVKIAQKLVVVTGSTAANPGGTGDPLTVNGPVPIITAITR